MLGPLMFLDTTGALGAVLGGVQHVDSILSESMKAAGLFLPPLGVGLTHEVGSGRLGFRFASAGKGDSPNNVGAAAAFLGLSRSVQGEASGEVLWITTTLTGGLSGAIVASPSGINISLESVSSAEVRHLLFCCTTHLLGDGGGMLEDMVMENRFLLSSMEQKCIQSYNGANVLWLVVRMTS